MGVLMAFAVGYVVGAKAGGRDFDEVLAALRSVVDSDEFADLLSALRAHLARTLSDLGELIDAPTSESVDVSDLVDRVRRLARRDERGPGTISRLR
jgi:hypothetical protein